ncbi:hypothetical protein [Hymenobacter negativus]|nr:hypothetical protein [Hymenobacter negativus]
MPAAVVSPDFVATSYPVAAAAGIPALLHDVNDEYTFYQEIVI